MANKTIVQLPEQTGVTDNDVLAIVDSGETTTSKIKVSTLLAGVGGAFQVGDATDSIVPSYSPTSRGVATGTTYLDKLNLEGEVYTSNANETFNLVQSNTTITDNPYNRAFAGHSNSKISSTDATGANMLMGTLQGQITSGSYNVLLGMGTVGGGLGNFMAGTEFTSEISGGGSYKTLIGGARNLVSGNQGAVIGGNNNDATAAQSGVFVGFGNVSSNARSVIIGGQSQTTLQDDEVVVPKLRTTKYASLNFSGDTAAAAGGVQLGEFYHDNGQVRIRIT